MLKPIHLDIVVFGNNDPVEIDRSRRAILKALFFLSRLNRDYFLTYPKTPRLYESGCRYIPEGPIEEWQDVPRTLAKGGGDCEDLACYRVGELMAQGIRAFPFISWREGKRGMIYHVTVRHPNGLIEDPSRALGMLGEFQNRPVIIGRNMAGIR